MNIKIIFLTVMVLATTLTNAQDPLLMFNTLSTGDWQLFLFFAMPLPYNPDSFYVGEVGGSECECVTQMVSGTMVTCNINTNECPNASPISSITQPWVLPLTSTDIFLYEVKHTEHMRQSYVPSSDAVKLEIFSFKSQFPELQIKEFEYSLTNGNQNSGTIGFYDHKYLRVDFSDQGNGDENSMPAGYYQINDDNNDFEIHKRFNIAGTTKYEFILPPTIVSSSEVDPVVSTAVQIGGSHLNDDGSTSFQVGGQACQFQSETPTTHNCLFSSQASVTADFLHPFFKFKGNNGVSIKVFNSETYQEDVEYFRTKFSDAINSTNYHFESPLKTHGASGQFVEYYSTLLVPNQAGFEIDAAEFRIYSKGKSALWISDPQDAASVPCRLAGITDPSLVPVYRDLFQDENQQSSSSSSCLANFVGVSEVLLEAVHESEEHGDYSDPFIVALRVRNDEDERPENGEYDVFVIDYSPLYIPYYGEFTCQNDQTFTISENFDLSNGVEVTCDEDLQNTLASKFNTLGFQVSFDELTVGATETIFKFSYKQESDVQGYSGLYDSNTHFYSNQAYYFSMEFNVNPQTTGDLQGMFDINIQGYTIVVQFKTDPVSFYNDFKILDPKVFFRIEGTPVRGGKYYVHCPSRLQPLDENSISVSNLDLLGTFTDVELTAEPAVYFHKKLSYYKLFAPITFDNLVTVHRDPQITAQTALPDSSLTMNGFCPNDDCTAYVIPVDEDVVTPPPEDEDEDQGTVSQPNFRILSWTYHNTTGTIDIEVNGLTVPETDLSVTFAGSDCSVVVDGDVNDGIFSCTLPPSQAIGFYEVIAGTHRPSVYPSPTSPKIPYDVAIESQLATIYPQLFMTGAIFPGALVSLDGHGFLFDGAFVDTDIYTEHTQSVTINGFDCNIVLFTNYQIFCFYTGTQSTEYEVVVTVNGISSNQTEDEQDMPIINSITPLSASPALVTTFTLSGEAIDTNLDNITIIFENADYSYFCGVCDATETQISCILNGGEPGVYNVRVTDSDSNAYDMNGGQQVTLGLNVADLQPKTGSQAGGTLLTITGDHFSTEASQNQITVGVRNVICDIESFTETEITCRTRQNDVGYDSAQSVAVLQRVSFEANCDPAVCSFEYSDSATPTITNVIKIDDFNYRLEGSLFVDGDLVVYVDGVQADNLVVNEIDQEAEFTVPSTAHGGLIEITAHVSGYGNAVFQNTEDAWISIPHSIASVAPLVGSQSGSILTVTGQGFSKSLIIEFGNGESCEIVGEIGPQEFQCEASGAASGELNVIQDTVSVAAGISYAATYAPQVSTIADSTAEIIFTLTGYTDIAPIAQFDLKLSNEQYQKTFDQFTQNSNDFTFTVGDIEAGDYEIEIILNEIHKVNVGSHQVSRTLSIQTPSSIQSSIAGGRTLTFSGSGFQTGDFITQNDVRVCNFDCEVTNATPSSLSCQLPAFVNTLSQSQYNLKRSALIAPRAWADDQNSTPQSSHPASDNDYSTEYSSGTGGCFIEADFGDDLQAVVDQVFITAKQDTSVSGFSGAKIQGSNQLNDGLRQSDEAQWTDIGGAAINEQNINSGANVLAAAASQGYRYYRIYQAASSSSRCSIAEFSFKGYIESTQSAGSLASIACDVSFDGQTFASAVEYREDLTPKITSLSPERGSAIGGTEVQIQGTGFSSNIADVTVTIDGVDCDVQSSTSTTITCLTGPGPALNLRSTTGVDNVVVSIANNGHAANPNHLSFLYIELWSDRFTWGCGNVPIDGDLIYVPAGLNLFVDDDRINSMNFAGVVVQGGLFFDDSVEIQLNTELILIQGGIMQAGTEASPYSNSLTITFTGRRTGHSLPIYGSNVLAVVDGELQLHGQQKTPAWTHLDLTAVAGSNVIELSESANWAADDEIIISGTGYSDTETEIATIDSVSNGGKTLTLKSNLQYDHISAVKGLTNHNEDFEMRAEVGVLSRNIKIQGKQSGFATYKHGAYLYVQGNEEGKTVSNVENVEFNRVGQAYSKDKFAVQFKIAGSASASYFRYNSIRNSQSRGIIVQKANDLSISNNVLTSIRGHAFVLQVAKVQNVAISNNLISGVTGTNTLYQSDRKPAGILALGVRNRIEGNAVSGVYGTAFYYDLQGTVYGDVQGEKYCPRGEVLGVFANNVAHSVSDNGLLIWPEFIPRASSCSSYKNDNLADPFEQNPPQEAVFENFQAWKIKDNGVRTHRVGAVTFRGLKVSDAKRSNIEVIYSGYGPVNSTRLENSILIGTAINGESNQNPDARGIISTRHENFFITNTRFYDFSGNQIPILADSSAITIFTEQLYFDTASISTKRVRWSHPYKTIFRDLDGTLINHVNEGTLTYHHGHLEIDECMQLTYLEANFENGIICNDDVELRALRFYSPQPRSNFWGRKLHIDTFDLGNVGNETSVLASHLLSQEHNNHYQWIAAFVAGYHYKLTFEDDLDFSQLTISQYIHTQPEDEPIELAFPHKEPREDYDLFRKVRTESTVNVTEQDHQWTPANVSTLLSGEWNYLMNDNELHVAITGTKTATVDIDAYKCRYDCPEPEEIPTADITNVLYWSQMTIPSDGKLTIDADTRVYFDVENSQIMEEIIVYGELIFDQTNDYEIHDSYTLNVKKLWVSGLLQIGSPSNRFDKEANIILHNSPEDEYFVINSIVTPATKVVVVTGVVQVYGREIGNTMTRLTQTAVVGDNKFYVSPTDAPQIQAGDTILVTSSSFDASQSEEFTVGDADLINGVITLEAGQTIQYAHYGAAQAFDTVIAGELDRRAELILLSRSVTIRGSADNQFEGAFIATQTQDSSQVAIVEIEGAAFVNLGRTGLSTAAVNFDIMVNAIAPSSFTNNVILNSNSYGLLVNTAQNINIRGNAIVNSVQYGAAFLRQNDGIVFNDNIIVNIEARAGQALTDYQQGYSVGVNVIGSFATSAEFMNNIVVGCPQVCYVMPGDSCAGSSTHVYADNVAHSGNIGWLAYNPSDDCNSVSAFTAYLMQTGVISYWQNSRLEASGLILVENMQGASLNIGNQDSDNNEVVFDGNYISAERICPQCDSSCVEQVGIVMPLATDGAKSLYLDSWELPWIRPNSDSVFSAKTVLKNNKIAYFHANSGTECDGDFFLKSNPHASDYTPRVVIEPSNDFSLSSGLIDIIGIDEPNTENVESCGGYNCSGLQNILVTSKVGVSQRAYISRNEGIQTIDTTLVDGGNGKTYSVDGNLWGHLHFDSLDSDRYTRIIDPVTITSQVDSDQFTNQLIAQRDKFEGGSEHHLNIHNQLARFTSLLYLGHSYNLEFTTDAPSYLRFKLGSEGALDSAIIKIPYYVSQNIAVYVGDAISSNRVNPLTLDPDDNVQLDVTDDCGTNIYNYLDRTIEFVITNENSCNIKIRITNSILASVRYEMTPEEFYANDGPTVFIDRVASVLGIEPWRIKIVSIERGSTKVIYRVLAAEVDNTEADVDGINKDLQYVYSKLVKTDIQDFSILDAEVLNSEFYLVDEDNKGNKITFTGGDNGTGNNTGDNSNNVDNNSNEISEDSAPLSTAIIAAIAGGSGLLIVLISIAICKSRKNKKSNKIQQDPKAITKPSTSSKVIPVVPLEGNRQSMYLRQHTETDHLPIERVGRLGTRRGSTASINLDGLDSNRALTVTNKADPEHCSIDEYIPENNKPQAQIDMFKIQSSVFGSNIFDYNPITTPKSLANLNLVQKDKAAAATTDNMKDLTSGFNYNELKGVLSSESASSMNNIDSPANRNNKMEFKVGRAFKRSSTTAPQIQTFSTLANKQFDLEKIDELNSPN